MKMVKSLLNILRNNMWTYFEQKFPDENRYIYVIWKNGKEEEILWDTGTNERFLNGRESAEWILSGLLLWKYRGE